MAAVNITCGDMPMKIEKKPCINIKTEQRHGYHEVDLTNSFEDFIR